MKLEKVQTDFYHQVHVHVLHKCTLFIVDVLIGMFTLIHVPDLDFFLHCDVQFKKLLSLNDFLSICLSVCLSQRIKQHTPRQVDLEFQKLINKYQDLHKQRLDKMAQEEYAVRMITR